MHEKNEKLNLRQHLCCHYNVVIQLISGRISRNNEIERTRLHSFFHKANKESLFMVGKNRLTRDGMNQTTNSKPRNFI